MVSSFFSFASLCVVTYLLITNREFASGHLVVLGKRLEALDGLCLRDGNGESDV